MWLILVYQLIFTKEWNTFTFSITLIKRVLFSIQRILYWFPYLFYLFSIMLTFSTRSMGSYFTQILRFHKKWRDPFPSNYALFGGTQCEQFLLGFIPQKNCFDGSGQKTVWIVELFSIQIYFCRRAFPKTKMLVIEPKEGYLRYELICLGTLFSLFLPQKI